MSVDAAIPRLPDPPKAAIRPKIFGKMQFRRTPARALSGEL
jgi:hypothetical protein